MVPNEDETATAVTLGLPEQGGAANIRRRAVADYPDELRRYCHLEPSIPIFRRYGRTDADL